MSFQSKGKLQGDLFERESELAVALAGFEIAGLRVDIPDAGVEADIIAHNKHGIAFYITCKGSLQGERPGCLRTDTLKKAIAEAYCLSRAGFNPTLLLASHLPEDGRGATMLGLVSPEILFDALIPSHDGKRLRWLAQADEAALHGDLLQRMPYRSARDYMACLRSVS